MVNVNSICELEHAWDRLISSNQIPSKLYRTISDFSHIDIDARKVGDIILDQQSLQNLLVHKRDLMSIADPIMKDLSRWIQNDTFIALSDERSGTALLTSNTHLGRVCPGMTVKDDIIRNSVQNSLSLVELKVYCELEECINGYFNSVIYPIHDNKNYVRGVFSMGSFTKEISQELRAAVYLGASLIESRYKYQQNLKSYSNSFIGSLPKFSLLSDENGYNGFEKLIGNTPQIEEIKRLGRRVAKSAFSVVIEGESGTGKELVAEAIHLESGRIGPFVPINCGAIPKELLQSELFGYADGTFTGGQKGGKKGKLEIADGGTIFLDEIGEMPLDMQVSLLRFLQDKIVIRIGENDAKKVDVRIIAATNRNLLDEIQEKKFRLDIYYRLNEINIKMPPLRQRKADIPLLYTTTMNRICQEHNLPVPKITDAALQYLINHDWPGNVREFQNVLKSALIRASGNIITVETLASFFNSFANHDSDGDSLQHIEKQAIIKRLLEFEGNISKTAKSLKINRTTLYRKIRDYGIAIE